MSNIVKGVIAGFAILNGAIPGNSQVTARPLQAHFRTARQRITLGR